MDSVNGNSAFLYPINFTNEAGEPIQPDSGSYTISDFFSNTLVKESTPLVIDEDSVTKKKTVTIPVTSINLLLTAEDNTIINPNYYYEIRIVTVTYLYNTTEQKTEQYEYKLINMAGIPIPGDAP
jgi:hypothetical protein